MEFLGCTQCHIASGVMLTTWERAWCFSGGIGPVVGGALAQQGEWRWIFCKHIGHGRFKCSMLADMNIPIAAFSFFMTLFTLRLPTPPGTMKEKLMKIDWGYVLLRFDSLVAHLSLPQRKHDNHQQHRRLQHRAHMGRYRIRLELGPRTGSSDSGSGRDRCFHSLRGYNTEVPPCKSTTFVFLSYPTRHRQVPFHILANRTSLSGYVNFLPLLDVSWIYIIAGFYRHSCYRCPISVYSVNMIGFLVEEFGSLSPSFRLPSRLLSSM